MSMKNALLFPSSQLSLICTLYRSCRFCCEYVGISLKIVLYCYFSWNNDLFLPKIILTESYQIFQAVLYLAEIMNSESNINSRYLKKQDNNTWLHENKKTLWCECANGSRATYWVLLAYRYDNSLFIACYIHATHTLWGLLRYSAKSSPLS